MMDSPLTPASVISVTSRGFLRLFATVLPHFAKKKVPESLAF